MTTLAPTIAHEPRLKVPRRELYANPGRPALVGLLVAAAFIGVMSIWSALAPISGAAIANGNLQVQGRKQTVQHPYGGVVKQLLVREGERVEKGQVLLTLFDSDPRAKLDVLLTERDATLAQEARLIAERDKRETPDFSRVVQGRTPGQALQQAMANETAIMAARKRQFDTETDVQRQKIAQLGQQIEGARAQVAGLEKQHELLQEETRGAEQLMNQGYGTKTRVLSLQRDLARLQADRGARLSDIARMQEEIAQTNLEIARLERTRTSEITDQLRTTQGRLAELGPKVDAARDVFDRTEIRAPATGAVVGLNVFTEGGVIQPGSKLLDVVPTANPLIAESRLKLSDVNEVTRGQRAEVRLISINLVERPTIYGTVETVSADRLTDEKTGEGYYAVEVALNEDDVRKSRIELSAGMPAEVIVSTRPRTLFEYLISPLRDEITGAFRER